MRVGLAHGLAGDRAGTLCTKPRTIFFLLDCSVLWVPFGLLWFVSPFYLGFVGVRVSMVIHA